MFAQFRHLLIDYPQSAPTTEQMAAIEDLLGESLPASFCDFLQVANGARLYYVIDVPTGETKSEPIGFEPIFSTKDGADDGTFIGEILSAREHFRIPHGVLPFACDGGGSMAFLDLTAEGKGRVIGFLSGLPEWTARQRHSQFVEVASSFDEYLAKLRFDVELLVDQVETDVEVMADIDRFEKRLDVALPTWRQDAMIVGAMQEARRRVTNDG